MWKKVRIPIFVGIGLLALAALAVVVGFWIRSSAINSTVEDSRKLASLDTVEGLGQAIAVLGDLARDYRDRGDVQAAYAYVQALDVLRHGPREPGLEKASKALKRTGPLQGGDLYHAASILVRIAEGKKDEAAEIVGSLPAGANLADELRLARAMSLVESGQNLEAQADLMVMAASKDPFLPAVTVLAKLRHRIGDLEGARDVLRSSLDKHPGRLDASLELALVLVDMGTDESIGEAEKLLPTLQKRLGDAPPVLASRGLYASGLLLLARKRYAEAAEPLCKAYKALKGSPIAAARCARARRLSGDVQGALKELGELRLGESTPTVALIETVESNLGLWRPRSASLAIQLMEGRPDVGEQRHALLSGTAALMAGEFSTAAKKFGSGGDTPIKAALAHIEAGEAKDARKLLGKVESGPSAGCAAALYEWSRGHLEQGLGKLSDSESCTPELRGRFLFHLGRHAEAVEALGAALGSADDSRLRILLARATYRTKGFEASKAMLDHLKDLEAESVVLLSELADAYVELGLVDDARGVAADAVERNPGKPDSLALQARILRITEDPSSAAEIALAAFGEHPDHPGIMVERAHAHIAAKELALAVELGRKAMIPGRYYLEACLVASLALDAAGKETDADTLMREAGTTLLREHEPTLAAVVWAEFIKMRRLRGGKTNIIKARGLFWGLAKKEIPGAAFFYEGAIVLFADGRRDDCVSWLHRAAAMDPAFKPPFERLSRMGELTEEESSAFMAVHGVRP